MTLTVDVYDTRAAQLATRQAVLLGISALLWVASNEVLFNELFRDTPSVFSPCRTNLLLIDCETDEAPTSIPDGGNALALTILRCLSSLVAIGLVWQSLCYHMNRHLAMTANMAPLASTTDGAVAVVQSPWLTLKACTSHPHSLAWRRSSICTVLLECTLLALHVPPELERLALAAAPQEGEAAALRKAATVQLVVAISMLVRLVLVVRAVYFARSDLVRPAGQFIRRFIELPGSPQLFMVKATFRERPVESTLGVFAVVLFFVSYLLRLFETLTCALLSVHPALISEGVQSAPAVPMGAIAGVVYFRPDAGMLQAPDLLCAPLELGDAVWLMLISSLTVGYGDVSAETHYGRAVSIAGTLLGILLTGVTIAAVIGFLRLSFPEQAVGQLLARAGSDKRFKHTAAIAIQATWRHFYAEHSFLTWVAGAGGSIAIRPVSGRLPLEIAARRAVFNWRQLRRQARRDNMNMNPILQRHIRAQNLLVKVEDLRADVEALLEAAGQQATATAVKRILQHKYDTDPARQLSAPLQVLSQAVSLVGAAAAAHKRASSNSEGSSSPRAVVQGGSSSPQTMASDGGTANSAQTSLPIRPAPMLGALGKSVSGFRSNVSLSGAGGSPVPGASTAQGKSDARPAMSTAQLLEQVKQMSAQLASMQANAIAVGARAPQADSTQPEEPPSPAGSSPHEEGGISVFTFKSPKTPGGGTGAPKAAPASLSPPVARDAKVSGRDPPAAQRKLAGAGDSKAQPAHKAGAPSQPAPKPGPPRKPAPPQRRPAPPPGAAGQSGMATKSSAGSTSATSTDEIRASPSGKGGWVMR